MKLLDKLDKKLNSFFEKTFGEGFERLGKFSNDIWEMGGNTRVSLNGVRIEVKNGKVKINGKEIPPDKISEEIGKIPTSNSSTNQKEDETFLKDGATKIVKGDITGNVAFNGNNITVIVEGDVVGNISGARTITVHGDHIGNS